MEYLDLLDDNGNRIGKKALRDEVHKKGLWHRAVHVWIINSKRELLIQRRSANKDVYPNKLYVSVAGHPMSGESVIEGLKREVQEEIGVKVDDDRLDYLFSFSQEVVENDGKFLDNQFYDVYLMEMDLDIDELKLQAEEVSEVKNIFYKDFENMVKNRSDDIVDHPEEWEKLFKILHDRYDD